MCVFSKPKAPPPPAERQATQAPKDAVDERTGLSARRRRGFWASIMTSPQGVSGAPTVTGTSAKLGV